jgi:branched-chain amino acid transport system ATP-binding protein
MAQFEVHDIYTNYGFSKILFGVSFDVEPGSIVALIGRNGVGKTTTMRSVMGLTPPREGRILWEDVDIRGLATHRIVRLGIGFVPEDRRIFPELTVWENLDIARRPTTTGESWTEEGVYELFPVLGEIPQRRGGVLSGGEQQMLTIARSLMGNPRLLLLDEPSEGLAPLIVETVRDQVEKLRNGGLSIVLAEQNLEFVLSLADQVHILEKGEIKFSGSAEDVRGNEEVLHRYLTI